jgi:hypothetical protein
MTAAENASRVDLTIIPLVEGQVQHALIPLEREHLVFFWRLEGEKFVHSLVISECILGDEHSEVREDRVAEQWPWLQSFVQRVLWSMTELDFGDRLE